MCPLRGARLDGAICMVVRPGGRPHACTHHPSSMPAANRTPPYASLSLPKAYYSTHTKPWTVLRPHVYTSMYMVVPCAWMGSLQWWCFCHFSRAIGVNFFVQYLIYNHLKRKNNVHVVISGYTKCCVGWLYMIWVIYIGYGLLFYDTIIDIWKPLWNVALKAVPSIFFMELLKKNLWLGCKKNIFIFFKCYVGWL